MPLHPALKQLIANKIAHTLKPQWELPIADVRQAFRSLWTPAMTGPVVLLPRIEALTIPGPGGPIPARLYDPDGVAPCPVMLYFHGGGYVKGGLDECDAFCRNLAQATHHLVVSIDYRLAPEFPFPAALDDVVAATTWVAAHAVELKGRSGPVVVGGESAGGNLAAVTCLALRGDVRVAIRHQFMLQPVLDFTLSFPSMAMAADEVLVPREDLDWYYRTYAGGRCDFRDPRVSPMFENDLSGLPPALIIAAEFDTLRDEAAAYARRLDAAGVDTRYLAPPGMIHGYLQMRGLVPVEVEAAVDAIAARVRLSY